MSKLGRLVAAAVVAGCLAPPAFAHHSFAMFDRDKKVTLMGTIREVQWHNPHTWLQVVVRGDGGATQEYSIECGSPNMMARQGWNSHTLNPGDKVGLVMHPMRDGSPAGSLVSVTLSDGRVLGPGGAPAPATGNAPVPK
jgi:hypothetical protein